MKDALLKNFSPSTLFSILYLSPGTTVIRGHVNVFWAVICLQQKAQSIPALSVLMQRVLNGLSFNRNLY